MDLEQAQNGYRGTAIAGGIQSTAVPGCGTIGETEMEKSEISGLT